MSPKKEYQMCTCLVRVLRRDFLEWEAIGLMLLLAGTSSSFFASSDKPLLDSSPTSSSLLESLGFLCSAVFGPLTLGFAAESLFSSLAGEHSEFFSTASDRDAAAGLGGF